ncbi:hypothetical protein Tco_0449367 [Tanacetum coccineum]
MEAQAENKRTFLNKLDDNIKKIIKDQVKEEVKAQVSKILPRIEKMVNEQLESEVMTRSSNESKISHVVAANLLSELEPKKILIDKMERNKRRDEEDKDEEPSAGSNQGSKRRRAGKEPESTSAPKDRTTKITGKSTDGFAVWFQKPAKLPTPDRDWNKTLPAVHGPAQPWLRNLAREDGPSDERIIDVTKLQIVEWHGYKHLDWITVRRDDDKLYTFKEGDFKRLRLQDIEDMLILLVQGKLTNLNVEDRLAFGVSLRMFTRSIVIQRRVEDLQLGVESYQKKLNITKPDTYRSDLKCRDAYTAYSNPRGFIYQNKDKKNKLMRIDELHKFSDGTLDDV